MKHLLKNEEYLIVLRDIEEKDAAFLMELNNDKDISKYVVGNPKIVTIQEQIKWMEQVKAEINTKRFIVEYKALPVGTVILSNIDDINLTANINIKMKKDAQGKGVGKQSVKLIVKYCFESLGLYCLTARVLCYNIASIALFNSCGFKKEGVLRSRVIKGNERYDIISFSLTRNDYYQR